MRTLENHICVRNLSASWLPDLTLTKQIGGTVYEVFGSYEGAELLDRNLNRILTQNLVSEAEKE